VGIGAIPGATFAPAARRALSPRALTAACAAAIATCALVLADPLLVPGTHRRGHHYLTVPPRR
jgi:hypothetical protein